MSVAAYSWADLGYRKLGPLPSSGAGLSPARLIRALTETADYEATPDHWVRRRGRSKSGRVVSSFDIIDVFDRNTELTNERLSFVDDYFRSEWAQTGVPDLTTDNDTLLSLVKAADTEDRWRAMYRLGQAIYYAGQQRLRPFFREHVGPCFFRLYPDAKIVVIRYNAENDNAAALMRALYAAAQTPLQEVRKDFAGIRTLQEWHLNSLTLLGPLLLDTFLYLFYPYVGGFRGGLIGLDFLFLFEPAEHYMPCVYPRNWLAVASTTARVRARTDRFPRRHSGCPGSGIAACGPPALSAQPGIFGQRTADSVGVVPQPVKPAALRTDGCG